MDTQTIKAVIICAVLMVFVCDLFLLIAYGPQATISWVVRRWSAAFPMLPFVIVFCMGALTYHLFIQHYTDR